MSGQSGAEVIEGSGERGNRKKFLLLVTALRHLTEYVYDMFS